jgi:arginine/ornithine N-succinyltransferase beta subunit
MTPAGIDKFLKPLVSKEQYELTGKSLYYFMATSTQRFYFDQMDEIVFDDESEVVQWKDTQTKSFFFFDYADINMVVAIDKDSVIIPTIYG